MPQATDFPTPLIRYLRVQGAFERELLVLLERAAVDADVHLRGLEGDEKIGRQIRRQQIRNAQRAINTRLGQLYRDTGDLVRARRTDASNAAIDSVMDPFRPMLARAGLSDNQIETMMRSQKATAARGVENAISRVTLTSKPLSERVYESRVIASGHLDRVITSAISRGVSAKELADEVRGFIRPDTPGGVSYAAQRLGRTELNNAFHGTQVQSAINSPFVTACRWHLSGSHPRPDECNEYAEGGDLRDGLWTPENVPAKPHPNCLCYLTSETPSRDEFLRKFREGDYNDWLAEQGAAPAQVGAATSGALSGAAKPTPVPKFPAKLDSFSSDLRNAYREMERGRPGGLFAPLSSAADFYKGYGFSPVNNTLRGRGPTDIGGRAVAKSKIDSTVKALDREIKSGHALAEDTTLMRGLRPGTSVEDYVEGEYVVEAGYSSTTMSQSVANSFSREHGTWGGDQGEGWVIDILAPKGTRALITGNKTGEEYELLLARNSKFKVIKVDPALRKIWMEVVP